MTRTKSLPHTRRVLERRRDGVRQHYWEGQRPRSYNAKTMQRETYKPQRYNPTIRRISRIDRRSDHAIAVDRGKKADTTLRKTDKNINRWKKEKSKTDLIGWDAPIRKRLRVARKRIKKRRRIKLKQEKVEVQKIQKKVAKKEKITPKEKKKLKDYKAKKRIRRKRLTGVERKNLKEQTLKSIKKDYGDIQEDQIDFHAYIDETLTYSENKEALREAFNPTMQEFYQHESMYR